MWVLAALLSARAEALECPDRLTRDDLAKHVEAAEAAYGSFDTDGFRDRMNELSSLLVPCMGDLVPPDLAARTHRLMAVRQLELGNDAAAGASLAAAHALAPDAPLPAEWLPADHPLRAAWDAAEAPKTGKAPEPRSGSLAFDGTAGRRMPKDTPTLVQVFDPSGVAVVTAYLGADDPLPDYVAIPRRRNTLIAGSGGAALGGAALLVGSYLEYRALLGAAADPTTPAADLDAARSTTNLLYGLGGGLIGVSVGLGAGAVAVGQR